MKFTTLLFLFILSLADINSQGNHVFTTGEAANFSSISISTPGTQTWSTDRAALPGYFSAVNGAAYTGASDASNINGYVKKYGNEVYTFPVGTGTDLRTLTINNSSGLASDAYAVAWIAGNPTGNMDPTAPNAGAHPINAVASDIVTVSPVGQWDWQVGDGGNLGDGTTGTGAGVPVSVSIPDLTLFATAGALRLVGWNGTQWVNLSGTTGATGNVENSNLSGIMIPGITAIAIGSTENVLSAKIFNFSIKEKNQCIVAATWSATEEIEINRYELEQSSDGYYFTKVSVTAPQQNSVISNYNSIINAAAGTHYYRLKLVDNNGKFDYTPVISLTTNCTASDNYLQVYPTLAGAGNNEITVETFNQNAGAGKMIITNNMGMQVFIQPIELKKGVTISRINTSSFYPGIYYVRITDAAGKTTGTSQKFIKQ